VRGDFDTLWFSAILFGGGGWVAVQGLRIALKRRVDNPLLELQGGKALALGLGACLLGLAAVAFAAREILAVRGGG
jgi:hypothetical protein